MAMSERACSVGVALAAVLVLVAAAAGGETPAAQSAAPQMPQVQWGPPSGGLLLSLGLEGDVSVGGRVRVNVSLKTAGGGSVALPPAKDVFGWVLVAQSTPGSKKAFYSERIPVAAGGAPWPAELSGDAVLALKSLDLTAVTVYSPQGAEESRKLLMAYVSAAQSGAAPASADLPRPAGKMGQVLLPGRAMAKFTLCLPMAGAAPVLVTSAATDILVGPPDLKGLPAEARQAFLADLLKQFDRDAWSGQQAHDTAVRLGPEVLPQILEAAKEQKRPAHARLWLATALADIRDERSVDALIQLLDDPMGGVRSVVAYHGPKQNSPRLDKAIIAKVQASKDGLLAAWAMKGFMVHRGTVPEEVLAAGLESDDPRTRATVAEALARHAGDYDTARLVALLEDKNERVRGTAAAMLGESGVKSPVVLGGLVKALDLPGETARQRICTALSRLTGRDMPYDPAADQATRDKTIAAWKEWRSKPSSK
jgi:hypothetical protein